MQVPTAGLVTGFQSRLLEYLPVLAGGLVVLALGVAVSWLVKRAIVRALIWLRLDRLGGPRSWRAAFSKGDVRSALYNVAGNIAMALVLLIFLENATELWGLAVLSRAIDGILVYLPNVALATLIVGLGILLADSLADRIEDGLEEEGIAHPQLLAKSFKGTLLAVVGALALWQLNFARQIVLAAFLIAFGAIGIAFAMGVGLGSARAIQRGLEGLFERRKDRESSP